MSGLAWLIRVLSYIFNLLLSFALVALGAISLASGEKDLTLEALPWKGAALNAWLICAGIFGLIAVTCAALGKLRLLFPLWCAAVLVMASRAIFFSREMTFSGPDGFRNALWFLAAALISFLASLTLLSAPAHKRRRP